MFQIFFINIFLKDTKILPFVVLVCWRKCADEGPVGRAPQRIFQVVALHKLKGQIKNMFYFSFFSLHFARHPCYIHRNYLLPIQKKTTNIVVFSAYSFQNMSILGFSCCLQSSINTKNHRLTSKAQIFQQKKINTCVLNTFY